jgi:hypothetical protein
MAPNVHSKANSWFELDGKDKQPVCCKMCLIFWCLRWQTLWN